eukprot:CAMPEP_0167767784 /NCGR_PEP_ID=MMETSP0110_2-20121227/16266_1 /TAXON_ID=629695 /ORGANISM="Gymnochlora sp., Strain CCMP2014" /LENGTH=926 /DNA_ID=CAMNT_0007656309 /DNA_START=59 /DNA_END=2839 /DNA_ORIENTATION=-
MEGQSRGGSVSKLKSLFKDKTSPRSSGNVGSPRAGRRKKKKINTSMFEKKAEANNSSPKSNRASSKKITPRRKVKSAFQKKLEAANVGAKADMLPRANSSGLRSPARRDTRIARVSSAPKKKVGTSETKSINSKFSSRKISAPPLTIPKGLISSLKTRNMKVPELKESSSLEKNRSATEREVSSSSLQRSNNKKTDKWTQPPKTPTTGEGPKSEVKEGMDTVSPIGKAAAAAAATVVEGVGSPKKGKLTPRSRNSKSPKRKNKFAGRLGFLNKNGGSDSQSTSRQKHANSVVTPNKIGKVPRSRSGTSFDKMKKKMNLDFLGNSGGVPRAKSEARRKSPRGKLANRMSMFNPAAATAAKPEAKKHNRAPSRRLKPNSFAAGLAGIIGMGPGSRRATHKKSKSAANVYSSEEIEIETKGRDSSAPLEGGRRSRGVRTARTPRKSFDSTVNALPGGVILEEGSTVERPVLEEPEQQEQNLQHLSRARPKHRRSRSKAHLRQRSRVLQSHLQSIGSTLNYAAPPAIEDTGEQELVHISRPRKKRSRSRRRKKSRGFMSTATAHLLLRDFVHAKKIDYFAIATLVDDIAVRFRSHREVDRMLEEEKMVSVVVPTLNAEQGSKEPPAPASSGGSSSPPHRLSWQDTFLNSSSDAIPPPTPPRPRGLAFKWPVGKTASARVGKKPKSAKSNKPKPALPTARRKMSSHSQKDERKKDTQTTTSNSSLDSMKSTNSGKSSSILPKKPLEALAAAVVASMGTKPGRSRGSSTDSGLRTKRSLGKKKGKLGGLMKGLEAVLARKNFTRGRSGSSGSRSGGEKVNSPTNSSTPSSVAAVKGSASFLPEIPERTPVNKGDIKSLVRPPPRPKGAKPYSLASSSTDSTPTSARTIPNQVPPPTSPRSPRRRTYGGRPLPPRPPPRTKSASVSKAQDSKS